MCRHLGYLGPACAVSEPVMRGPRSLFRQAWAPTDMRGGGTINADGFGVAWWASAEWADAAARRYRSAAPIWTDPAVPEVLSQIQATGILAAVRSATVGMPVERSACAPFTHGKWAFSHNGVVPEWRKTVGAIAADLGNIDLLDLEAATDSAALWLLLQRALTTDDAKAAVVDVVERVVSLAPDARLNLVLGDGEQLWATTYYHSLSVLVDDASVCVASEPYDDNPAWQAIPDRSVIVARPGYLTVEQI
ncbi:ergothioneine biosynthesis protein EgtC [Antrihabitans stalactiti]|uniref:Gamma-glutamyl-hercynylcysteine sulfoxide hydrolase n=1 Tax=Antrihabitans stalactiti TaxID=2584121 RepID=A0A848KHV8_9NOCA|nr:ergothioneine biosynthesis protein EgtC [Antrihabitans stalactiti]NMN96644.1 ergothioneine biosynthesis protein EgtC [Antrihabitans stalactiti]